MPKKSRPKTTDLGSASLAILEALGAFDTERVAYSGEALRERLGVSRTQVWKHIERLRARGYAIDGTPGGGYRLCEIPDRLYPELVQSGLNTNSLGKNIEHFDLVDSTNRVAGDRAREGAPHGSVILAEAQTAGKGRLGRDFFSPAYQNLYSSIILRPSLTAESAPSLVLSCATAVAEAIADEVDDAAPVSIKWPNDVLVAGRKTSGILLEMHTEAARISSLVIGIGINLNVPRESFPQEFRASATSLSSALGRKIARVPFTQRLLEILEAVLELHMTGGFDAVRPRFEKRFHMLGKRVNVREVGNPTYAGIVLGIDANGALQLQRSDGETTHVLAGDVTLAGDPKESAASHLIESENNCDA